MLPRLVLMILICFWKQLHYLLKLKICIPYNLESFVTSWHTNYVWYLELYCVNHVQDVYTKSYKHIKES